MMKEKDKRQEAAKIHTLSDMCTVTKTPDDTHGMLRIEVKR